MNKIIILFSSVVIILSIWSYDFFSFLEKIPKVENNSFLLIKNNFLEMLYPLDSAVIDWSEVPEAGNALFK